MYKPIFLLSILFLWISIYPSSAQRKSKIQQDYINQYKDIAISEMQRAGIPASITLAQGLLESESGKSWLAVEANNHFGMKCGSDWPGATVYKLDDDLGWDGNLVPSCFRKYDTPEASFRAHSDFLHAPNKPWYLPLFDLDILDYKAWAKGLLKAGYATNPKYADLLIELIERYDLHQYDKWNADPVLVENEKIEDTDPKEIMKEAPAINGIPYVLVQPGESIISIALRTGIPTDQLILFNDDLNADSQSLNEGQIVFLRSKKNHTSFPDSKLHFVGEGQTMVEISQLFGIKLSALLSKNRMQTGMEPASGSILKLRGSKVKDRPQFVSESENVVSKETIAKPKKDFHHPERGALVKPVVTPIPSRSSNPVSSSPKPDFIDDLFKTEFNEEQTSTVVNYHVVQKGETLWRISQRYGITVDDLKKWNGLTDNAIRRGQKLRVE